MSDSGEVVPLMFTEVIPGVAVVTGAVPPGLELIELDLLLEGDRTRLNAALSAVGSAASAAGNVGEALVAAQGLFRVSEQSAAILRGGAHLVAKDGANLGTIMQNGKIVAQARFIPVGAASAASVAASLGPALAMVAIQMQLGEITRLVRTNIALSTQVLGVVRAEQWATLTGLAKEIDATVNRARELQGVPPSAWQKIAGKGTDVETQLDLYRRHVAGHVRQLKSAKTHSARREYLTSNAEAIVFDAYALLTSLKAWSGYQAVHAGWASAAGETDPLEARHVKLIVADARTGFDTSMEEARHLVRALSRELRIIAELPGRATMPLTSSRRDARTARPTCAQLLNALMPLTEVFDPNGDALREPQVLCVVPLLGSEQAVRVLSWMLEDDEEFRVLAPALRPPKAWSRKFAEVLVRSAGATLPRGVRGAADALADSALMLERTIVAVTNRRVIVAGRDALLKRGEVEAIHNLADLRDVRSVATATPRVGVEPSGLSFSANEDPTVLFFPVGTTGVTSLKRALRGKPPMDAIRLPALPEPSPEDTDQ